MSQTDLKSAGGEAETKSQESSSGPRKKAPKKPGAEEVAFRTLGAGAAAGALVLVLFALQAGSAGEFLSAAGVSLMVAGAAAVAGCLLGFLFGIPQTLSGTLQARDGTGDGEDAGDDGKLPLSYRANTNLEQISDWLTKMLVGVGLTQLGRIPEKLQALAAFVAGGLGGMAGAEPIALGILLYYSIVGFLFGFLWSRVHLAGVFRRADQEALGALEEKVRKLETDLERRMQSDARALTLASQVLRPSPDTPPVSQVELNAAVLKASTTARSHIFWDAWRLRRENCEKDATKPLMERTIPIFRALIKSDVEGKYHMNHGQLGYALKDKVEPDWQGAEDALTRAIDLRDARYEDHASNIYEFVRAICRVNLDPAYGNEKSEPSEPGVRDRILSDLSHIWTTDWRENAQADEHISAWLRLNNLTAKKLQSEFKRIAGH